MSFFIPPAKAESINLPLITQKYAHYTKNTFYLYLMNVLYDVYVKSLFYILVSFVLK